MNDQTRLHALLPRLTFTQAVLLESMAHAMLVPVDTVIAHDTDIASPLFVEAMSNILALHHALHEEPLNKKSFEYMLKQCFLADGQEAEINSNPGDEAWDIRAAGQRWSLKTEAAVGISARQIKVEKLMEARWVREADTPDKCAKNVSERLPLHMRHYDRMLVLRAFKLRGGYRYFLEEIPLRPLVDALSGAKPQQFAKKGRSISYGADFPAAQDGIRAFRILLDSSVEKIRLWYTTSQARHHGSWFVHVDMTRGAQQKTIER